RIHLDVSKLDGNEVTLGLDGMIFGAATSLAVKVSDLNHSNRLDVHAVLSGLTLDAVSTRFDLPIAMRGSLDRFVLKIDGALEKPREWSGQIEAHLGGLAFDKQEFGEATVKINAGSGRATVQMVNHLDAKNEVTLNAEAALPEKFADFKKN